MMRFWNWVQRLFGKPAVLRFTSAELKASLDEYDKNYGDLRKTGVK